MRICFLNHTLDLATGAGRFGRSFLSALAKATPGFNYVVLTSAGSGAKDELTLLPRHWWSVPFSLPRIRRAFRDCDIIHALDGYPFGVIAALASLGLGKRLVITAIGTGALAPFRRPLVGRLLRWAYRRADCVVAVSHYTARELERGVTGFRIAGVINHGVDANEFTPAGSTPPEVASLKPYILSVGALKPRKGYVYSLRAFAELRQSHPSLRYVIVGNGGRQVIDGEISRLGLPASAVRVFTAVAEEFLKALYRNAELFLLLPYDANRDVEGFGLVFLEAAASGVPVIGTRDSGAADAVADGRNGFLVAPRDAAAAAEACRRILGDPALRSRLAAGSLALAAERSWARVAAAYQRLYRDLTGSGAGCRPVPRGL